MLRFGAQCVSVDTDDGAFAEDINYFYSRFDKHDSRFAFDDIISSTKTGGNLNIEEMMCSEYSSAQMCRKAGTA